jgi:xeroderma pigmentosum group C-complementing protein
MRLTEWWHSVFKVTELGHIRSRTFRQAQEDMHDDHFLGQFEVLRGPKSLSKRAKIRRGSRDASAFLFAALCRSLLIPTRLIVSLQSVPWQATVGKPKTNKLSDPKGKGKARAETPNDVTEDGDDEDDDEDDDMEEVGIPSLSDDAGTSSSPQMSVSSAFEDSPRSSGSKPNSSLRRRAAKTLRHRRNGVSNPSALS